MKKMALSALFLVSLPLYAKEAQEVKFVNQAEDKVQVIIRNRKNGVKVEERSLSSKEHFNFALKEGMDYTVEARELSGKKLKTGIYNLFLRPRYKTGTVTISTTTPFFRNEAILVISGKNAVVREPWVKPDWAKKKNEMVLK